MERIDGLPEHARLKPDFCLHSASAWPLLGKLHEDQIVSRVTIFTGVLVAA
jgi:hypothetical protein